MYLLNVRIKKILDISSLFAYIYRKNYTLA